MFKRLNDKDRKRLKRKVHIRKRIHGTSARPRLTVSRSNSNLAVQVINDDTGSTLASVSTLEKELATLGHNLTAGSKIGEEIGRRLKEKSINSVVFDRNGYLYHGVVKAIAEGARKAGIEF